MKTLKLLTCLVIVVGFYNCVQETKPKTITLRIDMNGIENIESVGVRGDTYPLSWDKSLIMKDENGNGNYTTTFILNSASYDMRFKFVVNDSVFELDGYKNRTIIFDYKPEVILYEAIFDNKTSISIQK